MLAGWSLSDKIAAIASAAAALQVGALVVTIGVMIRNGRRQLRAYLFLESGTLTDGTTVTPPKPEYTNVPGWGGLIKNSGQTPAYRVLTWTDIAVIEPINEEKLVVPLLGRVGPTSLAANGQMPKLLRLNRTLSQNEIDDIRANRRAIYVYGRIEYVDAFKKKRFTNFRLRYSGAYPANINDVMFFCDEGNDAN